MIRGDSNSIQTEKLLGQSLEDVQSKAYKVMAYLNAQITSTSLCISHR